MSKITKYNPFELPYSINNLFDNFFHVPRELSQVDHLQNINLNITEDDSAYYISADLAGIEEKNINVEIDKGRLTVKAKREYINKDKKHHIQECYYGAYQRTISLPDNIDKDKIEAKYANGVLNINIPKKEKSETVKKIPITS